MVSRTTGVVNQRFFHNNRPRRCCEKIIGPQLLCCGDGCYAITCIHEFESSHNPLPPPAITFAEKKGGGYLWFIGEGLSFFMYFLLMTDPCWNQLNLHISSELPSHISVLQSENDVKKEKMWKKKKKKKWQCGKKKKIENVQIWSLKSFFFRIHWKFSKISENFCSLRSPKKGWGVICDFSEMTKFAKISAHASYFCLICELKSFRSFDS